MIEVRKGKGGTSYRASIYDSNGERQTQTFNSKTLAKEWERRALLRRDEQEAQGVTLNDRISLAAFAERWMNERVLVQLSASTKCSYERALRVHILPPLGEVTLRELRVDHANKIVAKLKQNGHSAKGIIIIIGVLQALLNDAVEWQCLSRNPLFRYKPVKEVDVHFDYWSAMDIQKFFLASMFDSYLPLYLIALNTGMRRGEICGLMWDRIDFARGQIVVSRSLSRFGLSETTKSGRKRHVPMNAIVRSQLEKLLSERNGNYVLIPGVHQPKDVHHVYRDFHKAQRAAGFEKVIRFHDLRHTFASHFMMNGGNIYDLQKILGHSSLEMTQRYAHMSNDHLADAIKIVSFAPDAALGSKTQELIGVK